jgi:intergrase/recombinase
MSRTSKGKSLQLITAEKRVENKHKVFLKYLRKWFTWKLLMAESGCTIMG